MAKLTKMQITRLESELNKKIEEKVFIRYPEPALTVVPQNTAYSNLLDAVKKAMETSYSDVSIIGDGSDLSYMLRRIDKPNVIFIASFVAKKEYAAFKKEQIAINKIRESNISAIKKHKDLAEVYKKLLIAQKEIIMNDAYFRDSEYALDMLNKF